MVTEMERNTKQKFIKKGKLITLNAIDHFITKPRGKGIRQLKQYGIIRLMHISLHLSGYIILRRGSVQLLLQARMLVTRINFPI